MAFLFFVIVWALFNSMLIFSTSAVFLQVSAFMAAVSSGADFPRTIFLIWMWTWTIVVFYGFVFFCFFSPTNETISSLGMLTTYWTHLSSRLKNRFFFSMTFFGLCLVLEGFSTDFF